MLDIGVMSWDMIIELEFKLDILNPLGNDIVESTMTPMPSDPFELLIFPIEEDSFPVVFALIELTLIEFLTISLLGSAKAI